MIDQVPVEEELSLLKKTIKSFSKKEIEEYYTEWEKNRDIPRDLWRKMGEAGLLCVDIPEKYGGLGAPFRFAAAIVDEFSRLGYNPLSANVSVHSNIVAHYILNHGTEKQKQRYLPKMAKGEYIGAIAKTEPDAGSDLQGIRTRAVRDPATGNYVINGAKTFITNGQNFDFVIVVARTNTDVPPAKGITLLIVDAGCKGLTKGKKLKKIGLQASDTSELFFENVVAPPEQVLGEPDRGFMTLMEELPRERLTIAVAACAAMEGALEWTVQYLRERKAFGKTLGKFQTIRHKIAEMYTEAKVNRAFITECLLKLERNELSAAEASMAKLSATEAQGRVIDGCLQLFGGYGYMEEYPISRAYMDARVQRIYGGTSEIMKEIISRDILGK